MIVGDAEQMMMPGKRKKLRARMMGGVAVLRKASVCGCVCFPPRSHSVVGIEVAKRGSRCGGIVRSRMVYLCQFQDVGIN